MTDEKDEIGFADLEIDVVQCARAVWVRQRHTAKFDHVLPTSQLRIRWKRSFSERHSYIPAKNELRPQRRAKGDTSAVPRLRASGRRAGGRRTRSRSALPLRDRGPDGGARPDGPAVPG